MVTIASEGKVSASWPPELVVMRRGVTDSVKKCRLPPDAGDNCRIDTSNPFRQTWLCGDHDHILLMTCPLISIAPASSDETSRT